MKRYQWCYAFTRTSINAPIIANLKKMGITDVFLSVDATSLSERNKQIEYLHK